MDEQNKVAVTPEAGRQLCEWICELMKYSVCLWGNARDDKGAVDKFLGKCQENPYKRYMEDFELTKKELEDVASVIVDCVLKNGSPADIIISMSENLEVLLDDEKSERWLRPFASAERTSVNYQRGLALERMHEFDRAHAIMQKAADNGDVDCAMHLIEVKIKGEINGFKKAKADPVEKNDSNGTKRKSLAYECGLAWIARGNIERGIEILMEAANSGDFDCDLYLTEYYKRNAIK